MEFFTPGKNAAAHRECKCLAAAGLCALLFSTTAFSQGAAPAVSCESLAKLDLPEVTITLVQQVAAGQFKDPRSAAGEPGGPGGPAGQSGGPPKAGRPEGRAGHSEPRTSASFQLSAGLPQP